MVIIIWDTLLGALVKIARFLLSFLDGIPVIPERAWNIIELALNTLAEGLTCMNLFVDVPYVLSLIEIYIALKMILTLYRVATKVIRTMTGVGFFR